MDWGLAQTTLGALLVKSPLYLTWLVGIVSIAVYSKSHKKNATFLLIILLGLFVLDISGVLFNSIYYMYMMQSGMDTQRFIYISVGVNLVLILLASILWGLLIYLFLAKTRPKIANEN